ncbi:unnamed protein product [Protopolystoma xenopodis]|uniref:Uncharacterized protein n=1 Tax=Protopolystoma xenopodis TaxID=117903 RepID=A0A448XNH4_9PLAT|nr:unnamed protein product [Protopolystoma xenopodis]
MVTSQFARLHHYLFAAVITRVFIHSPRWLPDLLSACALVCTPGRQLARFEHGQSISGSLASLPACLDLPLLRRLLATFFCLTLCLLVTSLSSAILSSAHTMATVFLPACPFAFASHASPLVIVFT